MIAGYYRSEGLVQGPYMAARGGFEPATFHTEPPRSLYPFIKC